MRTMLPEKMEESRVDKGPYRSDSSYGMMGAFKVVGPTSTELLIISSGPDGATGWEHVSVSCQHRTPNWGEMCWVKDQFWKEDEMVVQYHPPKSEYVNFHEYTLHLWRPLKMVIPMPAAMLVGPKPKV